MGSQTGSIAPVGWRRPSQTVGGSAWAVLLLIFSKGLGLSSHDATQRRAVHGRKVLLGSWLRVDLLLQYRFDWPSRGYRVCMPMNNLPGALFGAEDRRNPQSKQGDILSPANLGLGVLYPHDVGELRGYVLGPSLEASDLAVTDERCIALQGLSNPLPSTHGRTIGAGEGCVFSMRPQLLPRFGVPFDEFAQRTLTLLNYLVKITYRSHLHLTSAVAWLSDLLAPWTKLIR